MIGSCTLCAFDVSHIIVELRNPIQMIIETNFVFVVGEVISETRASAFIKFPNARKQKKPRGLRSRGFKCFSRLET